MFYYLSGTLADIGAGYAVVDCGGVGYELTVSMITAEGLVGRVGEKVKLFTRLAVREDGVELFGFSSVAEREAYDKLTTVSGVGPKAGLAILSVLTPDALAAAIAANDTKAIARANGVGGKTAARVILELKDKFDLDSLTAGVGVKPTAAQKGNPNYEDALSALAMLGFDKSVAAGALAGLNLDRDVGEILKDALKKLAR